MAAASIIAAFGCAGATSDYAGLVIRTEAGAETIVPATLDLTYEATKRAFRFLEIKQTSCRVEDESQARRLAGQVASRDGQVWVTLENTPAGNVRVAVSARSRAANPDRDFASDLTAKIIEYVDKLSGDATSDAGL